MKQKSILLALGILSATAVASAAAAITSENDAHDQTD